MSNDVISLNQNDIQELNDEELEMLQTKVMNARINKLAAKINEANLAARKAENKANEANRKLEKLEKEQEDIKDIAVNSARVNAPRYDWVNQSTFGEFLEPSIGSRTFGKLLKVVGLAKRNSSRTRPYRKYVGKNKYARVKTFEKYNTTDWHYIRCLDFIDDWLEEHGYYKDFYSTEDETQRKEYIDWLYVKYVD